MTLVERLIYIAGRVLLGLIFLGSGFMKLASWSMTSMYMASKGLPLVPVLLAVAAAVEILGALSIMTGIRLKQGALILFAYLIPVTLVFHAFWSVPPGMEQQNQMVHFLKNLSIMGGLLCLASANPDRFRRA